MQTISTLISIVLWIIGLYVLYRLFKKEGLLKAILGFICMLYTFIWGWMHAKEEGITGFMWAWTVLWIIAVVVAVVAAMSAGGGGGGAFIPGLSPLV
jgi:hypothetical protein